MPSAPKLSILIPAYKARDTIEAAISSALCEHNVQFVVAPDDGTNDYKHLEEKFPGQVVVLEPTFKIRPGAGRNRAFEAATGDFLTMLDADDQFSEGAVSEAIKLCSESSAGAVFFQTRYFDKDSSQTVRETSSTTLNIDQFIDFNGSIHALYRKDLWQPYSSLLAEDVLHDMQILLKAGGTAPMTSGAYLLNLHSVSMCATTPQHQFTEDYEKISKEADQPEVRRLFSEKIAVGLEYEKMLKNHPNLGFHEFIVARQQKEQSQHAVRITAEERAFC